MSTTATTGQSPVPITTSTTQKQSPVSISGAPTTLKMTTGSTPVEMTTTKSPAMSTIYTFPATTEEETTVTRRPSPSMSGSVMPTRVPTGEEEVQLRPKSRRNTTPMIRGRK